MSILTLNRESGRKLIHLGSSVIPLGYWIVGRERAIIFLIVMTLVMIMFEFTRMNTAWGRRLYYRFFGFVTRPSEEHRPTGGMYVFVGYLLAAILFAPVIAILSMLFMSIGDTAAALVGQRYGRTPIGNKTLEGTLACFLVCLLLALPADLTLLVRIGGAASAALAELIPWPFLNDNITIPVLSGGAMTILVATGL